MVPCYNAARYLDEALASVWAQQVPNVDVVVVDDGSTDGSAAVAAEHGPAVTVLGQPNLGISAARNRGIFAARGELIAFLDADDVWTPGSLAARLAALEADPAAECAAGLVEQFVSPDVSPDVAKRLVYVAAPSRGRVAGTMLLRRSVFERVGLFDGSFDVGETIDWVSRADAAGVRTAPLCAVVLRRRIHGANMVRRAERLHADYLRVLRASIDRRRQRSEDAVA